MLSTSKGTRSAVVIIRGEITLIIASLRRATRWASHQQESKAEIITRKLQALKESLDGSAVKTAGAKISADANYFLVPFLDVIRSEETSGPVTSLALSSLEKFIAYEIINDVNGSNGAVEAITDAVIHAHFVSTDSASDEIVLLKILNVLHRLFISPLGSLLSNESVCELMQACFRMCFIERANELLKKSAETALTEMIRLLFSRLHSFPTIESLRRTKSQLSQPQPPPIAFAIPTEADFASGSPVSNLDLAEATSPASEVIDQGEESLQCPAEVQVDGSTNSHNLPEIQVEEPTPDKTKSLPVRPTVSAGEFKNSSGVKFTIGDPTSTTESVYASEEEYSKAIALESNKAKITVPYGIPCARELFRFLISIINPNDKQNTEVTIHLGLKLLLVSAETGIDAIGKHTPVMSQVKNELCKNLIALLNYQSPGTSAAMASSSVLLGVLRILLIIFENMRHSLKYQLEVFLTKMAEFINDSSANPGSGHVSGKWNYEQKEIALDFLVQMWKLPCFVTELYLNYDCDLFSSNLFEDTTKLLSKNSFPMQVAINSVHLLCLDGLVSILDGIEGHCTIRISNPNNSSADESSVFYHDDKNAANSPLVIHSEDNAVPSTSKKNFFCNGSASSDENMPTHEELMAIRHKKKIYHSGTEHFNTHASKGIEILQTHGLLRHPIDPTEMAQFLRENPLLDKKAIGDYISNRKHSEVLQAFVRSFDFSRIRIDEALRVFLETFRLPGEAGPIALILEEFSAHWSISNGNPFANVDAAYILSYQVIMLNVDQHNSNVKKQGNCMTLEGLKANVKGCNGQKDFDPDMLKDIYNAIKSEEIVMPAEQTGAVKENYVWKMLLRRGANPSCKFLSPPTDEGVFDHDLFSLSWGPIVAALSFIFDKTSDSAIITKALNGFRKCSTIAAHYGMSDVFDNLVISLCKFTSLVSGNQDLSTNQKSQASCRLFFQLVHRHGDILKEGWKNFIDCLVALFKLQVLPKILTESEDFTEPSGRVSLVRRRQTSVPRQETGLFSSIYSYIALSTDSPGSKSSLLEEEESRKKVQTLILECRPELLLSESKFLQLESLQELIKTLIYASPVPESKRKDFDEDQTAFVLEILLKISIQNRDRAHAFWDSVREHLFAMILASMGSDMPYLLERATVGLMRIALRLMRKEDLCSIVLQSLKILLYLRPASVIQLSLQMSFGLHEILKTTAANIHTTEEWSIIFTLLEYVGAGKVPAALTSGVMSGTLPTASTISQNQNTAFNLGTTLLTDNSRGSMSPFPSLQHSQSQDHISEAGGTTTGLGYSSGSDRGYTSDSELEIRSSSEGGRLGNVSPAQSWILLTQEDQQGSSSGHPPPASPRRSLHGISQTGAPLVERQLFYPDPKSLVKSCETLSFLVRDAAHITPDNFTLCVGAIRSFVEASTMKARSSQPPTHQGKKKRGKKSSDHSVSKSKSFPAAMPAAAYDADESDNEDQILASQQVSVQLLDLLHTLHTRASQIFQWWQKEGGAEEASLWTLGWKPLLQAIVVLCSDARKQVRTTALTYLQRALLVHDLQQLSPTEWQSCFNEVLFPLMTKLLETLNPTDTAGMEETRMRAATLLCKVFLQHLTPLLQLDSFTTLWLQILSFLDSYMHHSDRSELLVEAIPESLKNLLLVMETAGIFHTPEGYTKLWAVTWEKIDSFLPSLRADLIRSVPPVESTQPQIQAQPQQLFDGEENIQTKLSLINTIPPPDLPVVYSPDMPIEYHPVSITPPSHTSDSPPEDMKSNIPTSGRKCSDAESLENTTALSTPPSSPDPEVCSGRVEYTSILFGDGDEEGNTSELFAQGQGNTSEMFAQSQG